MINGKQYLRSPKFKVLARELNTGAELLSTASSRLFVALQLANQIFQRMQLNLLCEQSKYRNCRFEVIVEWTYSPSSLHWRDTCIFDSPQFINACDVWLHPFFEVLSLIDQDALFDGYNGIGYLQAYTTERILENSASSLPVIRISNPLNINYDVKRGTR
ncbi:hypothetical protein [Paenibacillus sp. B01]|uniref:hypothetical protein n=1 Tax=Paenibacillus sp. B01 TaxID=2660554 RepID=UPI00129B729D|nr:hypothetical protein [Paenibacillus sp. B01]QGG57885.1 hypothetical protein GE073_21490 [Paenibacillus sp. B01]